MSCNRTRCERRAHSYHRRARGGRLARVVTVTANAALDRTLHLDALRPGRRHLVQSEHVQAGGKGVNVSRVLAALGIEVRTIVVVGGETGRAIERELDGAGLMPVPVAAPGESRTCLEIVEVPGGTVTQLHGTGVCASEETARSLVATVEESLDGAEWLALCGSLPRGCPDDTYLQLVRRARRRGVRVALDTSGSALVAGWSAAPDLLRINRDEAAAALGSNRGRPLAVPPPDAPGAARLSVVSDGPRSAWAWTSDGSVWHVAPPVVRVRNPIGCGDAMMAGLLASLDGNSIERALRTATSIAAADAESELAGRPDLVRAQTLASAVAVEAVVPTKNGAVPR